MKKAIKTIGKKLTTVQKNKTVGGDDTQVVDKRKIEKKI